MKIQNLIVWSGPSGIVLAQRLAEKWEEVLIIEKRGHFGWNCYDFYDENWILIHKYWPHIFHTNYKDVWEYVNKFTRFTNYQHKVVWFIDGKIAPIPFNLDSLYALISKEFATDIEKSLLKYFSYGQKVSIIELREKAKEVSDKNITFIADFVFEKIFKNYTIKQWGIGADEIDQNVLKRVPILISKDDRYFQDTYQWMPEFGYTKMFENMLNNKHIKILLNTDYKDIIEDIQFENLFFTWPIDEYFWYKYGKLDYRKTLYQFDSHEEESFQDYSVVNYPNDYEFTRITEMKKFYPNHPTFGIKKTVTCTEYPGIWEINAYPIENSENLDILERYKIEAKTLKNIHFLWRLANYKYFNMDQTIKNILDFNIE